MLKFRKIFSLLLVLTLLLSLPITSFADKPDFVDQKKEEREERKEAKWENSFKLKFQEREQEERIRELRELIENLEIKLDLEELEEGEVFIDLFPNLNRTEALAELANLKEELKESQSIQKDLKFELKNLRKEMRTLAKGGYTEEELAALEVLKEELEDKYEGITVLGVDSIISNYTKFKFDTPPVIKGGRTLIPVSALVKGFGASVKWNENDRSVLIWRDDNHNGKLDNDETDILIYIDSNITFVDGHAIKTDTEATIMNNRTIVPLRFIAETLHLKVYWHPEDRTIEIDDSDTTLTISGAGFYIVGTKILVPSGTTSRELDLALTEAENGTYTIENGANVVLAPGVVLIPGTHVVVSVAGNGVTEEIYSIGFSSSSKVLKVEGLGFSIDGLVILIPEGTSLGELDDALTAPVGGKYVFKNSSNVLLQNRGHLMLETDKVVVTAKDNTTRNYSILYASDDATLTSNDPEITVDGFVVTIPFGTTLGKLDSAIIAPVNGDYSIQNKYGLKLTITANRILVTDKVVAMAQNGETKAYSIIILENDDTTLTISGIGMSIENKEIRVPEGTTRIGLRDALTAAENGTFYLAGGLVFDTSDVTESIKIVSRAQNGSVDIYNIAFASSLTQLSALTEGFDVTGTVITAPYKTTRAGLVESVVPAERGTYTIQKFNGNVLAVDQSKIIPSNKVVSLAEDGTTEEEYSFVIKPASTDTTLSIVENDPVIDVTILGTTITIPAGATVGNLKAVLIAAVGGTYTIEDGESNILLEDDIALVTTDVVVSLAQDETTEVTYTIEFEE